MISVCQCYFVEKRQKTAPTPGADKGAVIFVKYVHLFLCSVPNLFMMRTLWSREANIFDQTFYSQVYISGEHGIDYFIKILYVWFTRYVVNGSLN